MGRGWGRAAGTPSKRPPSPSAEVPRLSPGAQVGRARPAASPLCSGLGPPAPPFWTEKDQKCGSVLRAPPSLVGGVHTQIQACQRPETCPIGTPSGRTVFSPAGEQNAGLGCRRSGRKFGYRGAKGSPGDMGPGLSTGWADPGAPSTHWPGGLSRGPLPPLTPAAPRERNPRSAWRPSPQILVSASGKWGVGGDGLFLEEILSDPVCMGAMQGPQRREGF